MAISRIDFLSGTGSTAGGGGTTVTVDVSSLTLVEDDILIVAFAVGNRGADGDLSCSGNNSGAYTELADLYFNDSNDTNLYVGYQIVGATADTSLTLTMDASSASVYHVIQYRGVDITTPIDVATTTATGGNTDLANPPSITPTTSGAEIVAAYAGSQNTLTAWTAPANVSNFNQTASTQKGRLATADHDWTSGAFDPDAVTGGDGDARDSWCAATLALRPASGGGSPVTFSFGTIF